VEQQSAPRGASYVLLSALWVQALVLVAAPRVLAQEATLRVGRLTLHRCETAAPWCAVLERPLDPSGALPGVLPVYFEYYPHAAPGPAAGTLVATEGGPGYPATESRDDYLALFAPLRARYDVLIMDNRGTGRSGAIDCSALQNAPKLTESNIGACGQALGRAAGLYSTALAVDDLAAVLDALGVARIALYGNSYGTYFAQVFALRHRDRVRALVLDGAYPLGGPDYAWYPHYAPAMRARFNLACERDPACSALPGSSLDHIAPALARLRSAPLTADVRHGDGRSLRVTADASALAIVMFGGSPALATVREVDAAARAFTGGDALPMLRLMAETLASVDSRDPTHAPAKFSAGLAAAVFCHDAPQIFDMQVPAAERAAVRDRIVARRQAAAPSTYAPFTIAEYRGMPPDYTFIDECVGWPAPPAYPPSPLVFPAASYPDVPVLVISGDLDNMTSVADGQAAAERFSRAHHVVITNGLHVNALPHARGECAAVLVRRFVATLATGDERCTTALPPVRLVARFARAAHELAPARALAGNRSGDEARRVVSAALLAAEDVVVRAAENGAGPGIGLRGGTFTAAVAGGGYRLTLEGIRWTEDVAVSGSVDAPGRSGVVRAQLEVRSAQSSGSLELRWAEGVRGARATARGTLSGTPVVAQAPAP
jgi:pimeloyl-ACP methyl ester carboxylesterase